MSDDNTPAKKHLIKQRFQGYLPVVVDVETGGVNARTDALLEIAAVHLDMDPETGLIVPGAEYQQHIEAFEGARIDEKALEINKIQPHHPFRFAEQESVVIPHFFDWVAAAVKKANCRRAVLVGHNANFDLGFMIEASKRVKLHKKTPFHAFTVFDTATLAALAYGRTVLAKALQKAKIEFNKDEAHSALYDAKKTAELFCQIVNNHPY